MLSHPFLFPSWICHPANENAYNLGIASVLSRAMDEYRQTGSVSSSTVALFGQALRGDLFWVLFGVTTVINIALMALSVVTNVWGFFLSMAVGLIIGIIVEQAFSAQQAQAARA